MRSIVEIDKPSGVRVIVGARQSEYPTDRLVSGGSFARLIEGAVRTFDVVILDTPPLGPVVDGLYLSTFADAIAMIVKSGATSQREVKNALIALNEAKRDAATIVPVLNQVNERVDSYRSNYNNYYSTSQ